MGRHRLKHVLVNSQGFRIFEYAGQADGLRQLGAHGGRVGSGQLHGRHFGHGCRRLAGPARHLALNWRAFHGHQQQAARQPPAAAPQEPDRTERPQLEKSKHKANKYANGTTVRQI